MTANDILRDVRISPGIADNDSAKYSDYQLVAALNRVLHIIYNALAIRNNSILNRRTVLIPFGGEAELPEDFHSMVSCHGEEGIPLRPAGKSGKIGRWSYRIIGMEIHCDPDELEIDMEYKRAFVPITVATLDDDLDLPFSFSEILREYTIAALLGGMSEKDREIAQRIEADVQRLVAGRDYSELVPARTWAGAI